MGIFDLLKKKGSPNKSTNAKAPDNELGALSSNSLVSFIRSNLDDPSDENVLKAIDLLAKPADDLEHLTPEGELPWGWHTKYKSVLKQYEDQIIQTAVDLRRMSGTERIAQLEKLVSLYNEYKRFCYGKDECHAKYFSDMWEHCHNSRCKDFEYITPFLVELEALKNRKGGDA